MVSTEINITRSLHKRKYETDILQQYFNLNQIWCPAYNELEANVMSDPVISQAFTIEPLTIFTISRCS